MAKGLAIVGGAAVLGLGMATKASVEFNREMSNVHAAMYGNTDDTVQNFTDYARPRSHLARPSGLARAIPQQRPTS